MKVVRSTAIRKTIFMKSFLHFNFQSIIFDHFGRSCSKYIGILFLILPSMMYSQTCPTFNMTAAQEDLSSLECEKTILFSVIDPLDEVSNGGNSGQVNMTFEISNPTSTSIRFVANSESINPAQVPNLLEGFYTLEINASNTRITFSWFDTSNTLEIDNIPEDGFLYKAKIEGDAGDIANISLVSSSGIGYYQTTGGPLDCNPSEFGDFTFMTGGSISGKVVAFQNENAVCFNTIDNGILNAEISVKDANGDPLITSYTEESGDFKSVVCPEDGPYEVCVESECSEPCGIDVVDLYIAQQGMLGLRTFTWQEALIADLNQNGTATHNDLLNMRKAILELSTNIDNWCRFIPSSELSLMDSYHSLNGNNTNDQSIDYCQTVAFDGYVEFARFVLGDLDGSCHDCAFDFVEEEVDLEYVLKGTEIKVNFSDTTKNVNVVSVKIDKRTSFDVDSTIINLPNTDYKYDFVDDSDYYQLVLHVDSLSIKSGSDFITLKCSKTMSLSDVAASTTDSLDNANIITDSIYFLNPVFSIKTSSAALNTDNNELNIEDISIEVGQVRGNRLNVRSSDIQNVDIFITDINGVTLASLEAYNLTQGINQIVMPNKTGIYFITVESDQGIETFKVFKQK